MELSWYIRAGVVISILIVPFPLRADTFYVSPNGSDAPDCPGTETNPFASLNRAQESVSPGDTVLIRGGTYVFSGTQSDTGVTFTKSGSSGLPINYWAYEGETPVFDFFGLTPLARIKGFSIRASFLHFKGLELTGVQQILTNVNESWCIRVEDGASDNIFEQLNLHHNEGPGLFIADGGNNRVVNVDSHHNYDPDRGGENADGFGCHSDDPGNIFSGCRAWYNSDDGFDFINSPGVCTVENSWAFYNGFIPDTSVGAGNGAGIKAGGFGLNFSNFPRLIPRHIVRFNLSFGNRSQGFYANHHPGGIDWFNNTAFNNPRNFDMLADMGPANHMLRNNLAAGSGEGLARQTASEIDDLYNSWSLPVAVTDDDFLSVSEVGMDGPRNPDGRLPQVDFLQLQGKSDLIDVGVDIGFPYGDLAPDLGAFESNLPQEADGIEETSGSGASGTTGEIAEAGKGGVSGMDGSSGFEALANSEAGEGGVSGMDGSSGFEESHHIETDTNSTPPSESESMPDNSAHDSFSAHAGDESGSEMGEMPTNSSGCSCQTIGHRRGVYRYAIPWLLLVTVILLCWRYNRSAANLRIGSHRLKNLNHSTSPIPSEVGYYNLEKHL